MLENISRGKVLAAFFIIVFLLLKVSETTEDIAGSRLNSPSFFESMYEELSYSCFGPTVAAALFGTYWAIKLWIQKARMTRMNLDTVPGTMLRDSIAQSDHVTRLLATEKASVTRFEEENNRLEQEVFYLQTSKARCSTMISKLQIENIELIKAKNKLESQFFDLRKAITHARQSGWKPVASKPAMMAASTKPTIDDKTANKMKNMAGENARLKGDLNAQVIERNGLQDDHDKLKKEMAACQERCLALERTVHVRDSELTDTLNAFSKTTVQDRIAKEKLVAETRANVETQIRNQLTKSFREQFETQMAQKMEPYMTEGRRLFTENQALHAKLDSAVERGSGLQQQLEIMQRSLAENATERDSPASHANCKKDLEALQIKLTSDIVTKGAESRKTLQNLKEQKEKEIEALKTEMSEKLEQAENARVTNHRSTMAAMDENMKVKQELNNVRKQLKEAEHMAIQSSGTLAQELQDVRSKLLQANAKATKYIVEDRKANCVHSCPRHCRMGSRHTKAFENLALSWEIVTHDKKEALKCAEEEMKEDKVWEESDPESEAGKLRRESTINRKKETK